MLAVTLATAGALLMTATPAPSAAPDAVRQRLQAIASSTVLFGHQSVGGNVLEGLRALAREQGVELRVSELQRASELRPGTFGHVLVAENGQPRRKLASFAAALEGGDPDVALVKLCYVDFDAGTDAGALFAAYEAAIRDLRARHPRTTFVHVTAPVIASADEGLARSLVKRLLGKASWAALSNARRDAYNALLRTRFPGEPVFDLAQVEATDPSGQPVSALLEGKPVPMLARVYTDDGGHLNAEGSRRAALALVEALGQALAARAKGPAGGDRAAAR